MKCHHTYITPVFPYLQPARLCVYKEAPRSFSRVRRKKKRTTPERLDIMHEPQTPCYSQCLVSTNSYKNSADISTRKDPKILTSVTTPQKEYPIFYSMLYSLSYFSWFMSASDSSSQIMHLSIPIHPFIYVVNTFANWQCVFRRPLSLFSTVRVYPYRSWSWALANDSSS